MRPSVQVLFFAALAVAFPACSGNSMTAPGTGGGAMTITATMTQAMPSGGLVLIGDGCLAGSHVTTPFDLAVTAASTVDMQHLTLHLNDGSNVGGAAVTFPHATLTSQFQGTVIVGGTTRVFHLQPDVACGTGPWRSASLEMSFLDSAGAEHVVTAATLLR